jgi:hypothetical protein
MDVIRNNNLQEDCTKIVLKRNDLQELSNEGCVSIENRASMDTTAVKEVVSVQTNPTFLPDTLNNISNIETDSERKFEDALTALQHSIQLINHLTEDRVLEKPKRKELDTLINTYQFYENVRNNYE